MKSMTGFGRAKKHCANYDISIDISSVNKKGMELSVSMPREWAPMERLMAQTLKKTVTRGKISVSVRAENRQEGTDIPLDDPRLHEIFNRLKQTCSAFEVKFEPTADLVIKIAEMLSVNSSCRTRFFRKALLDIYILTFLLFKEKRHCTYNHLIK